MDVIVLQQHFYGSVAAGHGLAGNRGFQTIARSAELADEELLERHSDYQLPDAYEPPRPDADLPAGMAPTPPVNWGWFELGDGRVCLHRIGDADTDEIGRAGNLLAHNLVVTSEHLAAIDFDLPALFRWVARCSPIRYGFAARDERFARLHGFAAGADDGFARLPRQVNQVFGTDRAALLQIEPLSAPVEEVRALRDEMDRTFRTEVVEPLREALGQKGLSALLGACLCPREKRRPIVVHELGGGRGESAMERKVVELYFGLLPYHYRRHFWYATYQSRLPVPGDLVPAADPHKRRRLLMTTSLDEIVPPRSSDGAVVWFIDGGGRSHVAPSHPSDLARRYGSLLNDDESLAQLRASRDLAAHFGFGVDEVEYPDELQSLRDVWNWPLLRKVPIEAAGVETYIRAAHHVRGAFPEVLDVGHRVVDALGKIAKGRDELTGRLVVSFCRALSSQVPRLFGHDAAARLHRAQHDVSRLFALAVQDNVWTATWALIWSIGTDPRLEPLRGAALESFAALIERGIASLNLPRMAAAWAEIRAGCNGGGEAGRDDRHALLGRVATHFLGLLLEIDDEKFAGLRSYLEVLVLPVFLEAPFHRAEELLERFDFLERVAGADSARFCGRYIVDLSRSGRLSEETLKRLVRNERGLVLRFSESWGEATRGGSEAMAPIRELLRDPALPAEYWRIPLLNQDHLLHRGLEVVLAMYRTPAGAEGARELARLYLEKGASALIGGLETDAAVRTAADLALLSSAHSSLIGTLAPVADEVAEATVHHLTVLLGYLLSRPLAPAPSAEEAAAVLDPPLGLVCTWFTDPRDRLRLVQEVALTARRLRAESGVLAKEGAVPMPGLAERLQARGMDPLEALWHTHRIRLAVRWPAGAADEAAVEAEIAARADAELLLGEPRLAEPDGAEGFPAFFRERVEPRAWAEVGHWFVADCIDPARGGISSWFGADSARKPLVEALARQDLLGRAGEAVADRLAAQGTADAAIRALDDLLSLNPHEQVAMPARGRLQGLMDRRLAAIRQGLRTGGSRPADRVEALRDLALCRPALRLGTDLGRDQLLAFWERLGVCLPRLGDPDLLRCFPEVFVLGGRLERWFSDVSPEDLWWDLFRPLAEQLSRAESLLAFVAAGDSLFVTPEGRLRRVEGAGHLAEIHHLRPVREWIYAEHRATGYAVVNYANTHFFDALCDRSRPGGTATESEGLLAGRAQLAAALFAPQFLPVLAALYHRLGRLSKTSAWDPTATAAALLGYLVADGTDGVRVRQRADQLLAPRFWKVFRNLCEKGARQQVCGLIGDALRRQGVKPGDVDAVVHRLRSGMRSWYQRLLARKAR